MMSDANCLRESLMRCLETSARPSVTCERIRTCPASVCSGAVARPKGAGITSTLTPR